MVDEKDAIAYTKLDARTAAVLDQRVLSLEKNVAALIMSIEKLNTSFEKLALGLSQSEKTNWPNMVAISGLFITVIAGLWFLAINPLENRISRIEDNRFSTEDGPQNVKIENLAREIERLRNQVKHGT